jgi:hypothetical protein
MRFRRSSYKEKSLKTLIIFLVFLAILAGAMISILLVKTQLNTDTEGRNVIIYQNDLKPNSAITNLAKSRVFFGHQSVGLDIVDGLNAIVKENSRISLNITETRDISDLPRGTFAHWKIGRNTKPESKIRAFRKIILENPVGAVDIALMKFCYVDISNGTDVELLFEHYARAISELQSAHPDTVFVHVTVPIESMPKDLPGMARTMAKRLLRRPTVIDDNEARQDYNQLVRSHYEGREPVFDLALYEALDRNGNVTFARSDRGPIQFMERGKTTDGGHLNEIGKRFLGEQLLVFLAEQLSESH